jgi:Zn-dependent protease with chaperone function
MDAIYYDGQTARARRVTLAIEGDTLVVSAGEVGEAGEAGEVRRDVLGSVQIMEAIGDSPRVIRFVGGASCEVADAIGFHAWVRANGIADAGVSVLERSGRMVAIALVLILLAGFAAYRYGLPAMATAAANRLPASALDTVSHQLLTVLDRTVFGPTQLPNARVVAIGRAFNRLDLPEDAKNRLRLSFRSAEGLGANALALPSGLIIVTDQLVALTEDDRLILAVIAHEAGHVHRRHGMRQVIQSSVVAVLVTWYLGDVSALGAAAPSALLQAKYSRDLEREADAYAAGILARNGMPVALLIEALEALERANGQRGDEGPLAYLSSHPATAERIAWLRRDVR